MAKISMGNIVYRKEEKELGKEFIVGPVEMTSLGEMASIVSVQEMQRWLGGRCEKPVPEPVQVDSLEYAHENIITWVRSFNK